MAEHLIFVYLSFFCKIGTAIVPILMFCGEQDK
jgi:hypothetical protein